MNPGCELPDLLNELFELRLRYHFSFWNYPLEAQHQSGANSDVRVINDAFGHPVDLGNAPSQNALPTKRIPIPEREELDMIATTITTNAGIQTIHPFLRRRRSS